MATQAMFSQRVLHKKSSVGLNHCINGVMWRRKLKYSSLSRHTGTGHVTQLVHANCKHRRVGAWNLHWFVAIKSFPDINFAMPLYYTQQKIKIGEFYWINAKKIIYLFIFTLSHIYIYTIFIFSAIFLYWYSLSYWLLMDRILLYTPIRPLY